MDKKTVFVKTIKGENETKEKGGGLFGDLKRVLSLIDGQSSLEELSKRSAPSLRSVLAEVLEQLLAEGYVRDNARPFAEPKIISPRIVEPKPDEELDFTSLASISAQKNLNADAENLRGNAAVQAKEKEENDMRARAELEAALDSAKIKVRLEAEAKAEAMAKHAAEAAARNKAEADARAKQERALREQAEAKAKIEFEARMHAERLAAQAKLQLEAAVKAKAEVEARARQEIEAARIKAEQEAAKAEAKARALAEERIRQETEAARAKAIHEAARIKAEQEVAQAKVEAAAQALAEERIRVDQAAAKVKADAEAARIEAVRIKAGQEYSMREVNEESQRLADEQARVWAAAEQRARDMSKIEAERSVQLEAPVKASAVQPPSRGRRAPLPVGKMATGLLVLLVLLMWFVPRVMPLDGYSAAIEKKLSAQFKQPVQIGALHAVLLPWPKLQLEKVTIGSGQELKVESAVLVFEPLSLFSEVKNISEVELQDVTLDAMSLEKESVWLQEIGANPDFRLSRVKIQRIKLSSAEVVLPLFNGEVGVNGAGRIDKVTLASADAKFDLSFQSVQDRWQITLNAKGTALPMFPNVLFDDFTANGEIGINGANFAAIDAQAYGGFLHGNAKLTWQKGWQLQGRIGAKSVELVKLFPKFGISGELQGDSNFSSSGSKLVQIADDLKMDGSFAVKKGVVNNMDMVETLRQGNRQAGRTHFDELIGNFQSNGRGQHFQQLQVTSSILSGTGSFDVSTSSQISGRLSVELKARPGASSLGLSGTLTEPILRPARER